LYARRSIFKPTLKPLRALQIRHQILGLAIYSRRAQPWRTCHSRVQSLCNIASMLRSYAKSHWICFLLLISTTLQNRDLSKRLLPTKWPKLRPLLFNTFNYFSYRSAIVPCSWVENVPPNGRQFKSRGLSEWRRWCGRRGIIPCPTELASGPSPLFSRAVLQAGYRIFHVFIFDFGLWNCS
jgi:hypothetical protein